MCPPTGLLWDGSIRRYRFPQRRKKGRDHPNDPVSDVAADAYPDSKNYVSPNWSVVMVYSGSVWQVAVPISVSVINIPMAVLLIPTGPWLSTLWIRDRISWIPLVGLPFFPGVLTQSFGFPSAPGGGGTGAFADVPSGLVGAGVPAFCCWANSYFFFSFLSSRRRTKSPKGALDKLSTCTPRSVKT